MSERAHDIAGRIVEVKHSDGTFVRLGYDPGGLVIVAENECARVDLERDLVGRVVLERVNGRQVRSAYDLAGNRTELTTSLGARQSVERDPRGEVAKLFFGRVNDLRRQSDVRFERDTMGLELARCFSNGIEIDWQRDSAGRPQNRTVLRRRHDVACDAQPGTAPERREIEARVYQWRGEDQIAAIVDAVTGPRFYDHDGRGRLVRERHVDRSVDRAIDAVGNVYAASDGRDRRYGAGGRLEAADHHQYEYDAEGKRTRMTGPRGTWAYAWNGHGLLKEVSRPDGTKVAFDYDPFGRRIAKRVVGADGSITRERVFVWDSHVVVHELDSHDGLVTWHFEPESFTPLAKEQGGQRWAVACDHLGTPSEMYDELGELAWKMQLSVFGVPTFESGTSEDCPWRWPGQYHDAETGLYYNNQRYFDPERGLYISPDPISLAGGIALYAYVADPLAAADFFGLNECVPRPTHPILVDNSFLVRAMGGNDEALRILREAGRAGQSFISLSQFNEFMNVTRAAQRSERLAFFRRMGVQQIDPFDSREWFAPPRVRRSSPPLRVRASRRTCSWPRSDVRAVSASSPPMHASRGRSRRASVGRTSDGASVSASSATRPRE